MRYEDLYKGAYFTVEASEDVLSFFEDGSIPQRDRAKALVILQRLADNGRLDNIEIFRHEEDGIYAVKSNQVRVYCWFSKKKDRVVVAAHTAIKKQRKAHPNDLKRTKELRKSYEGEEP